MWDYWYDLRQLLKQMENPPLWEKVLDREHLVCYNPSQRLMRPNSYIKQPVSRTGFKRGQRR